MAGGRIKGITIEINGDAKGLKKALEGIDGQLRKTNGALRDVDRLLKIDPGNTELLEQKQRLLNNAIKDTKKRLTELKEASKNVTPDNIGQDKYDALQREIVDTENKLKSLEKEYDSFGSVAAQKTKLAGEKMQKLGDGMKDVGEKMTKYVTLPLAAAFVASTKSAIDWESDFTGVMNTVDETATTLYEDIEKGIKDLSTRTASTKGDIAKVAEVAGQLGISADDIVGFTETMVQLGDTTNLSAEDAATNLARFMNITGETSDHADELGSAIVELGNNFATDEASIVNMSTRLAAAGRIAGLSSQDILALSASMSSVGIEAEAGGTAMSQTLTTISQAVAAGGEDLDKFAQVAGMSSEEFSSKWKTEPIKAVQAFVGGLGNLNEEGEDTYGLLDELGMSGIRQSNMLQSLALASDVLTEATEMSNGAYEDNTALQDEASKRYETAAAKLSQMRERIENVAIAIGERLMPYVERALDFVDKIIQKWDELSPVEQDLIVKIGLVIAAVGPLLLIIGQVVGVIGWITTNLPILAGAIAGLAGPGTLIIGIIAAVIAIGILLGQHWDEVCAWASNLKEKVSQAFENMRARISGAIEGAKAKFEEMKNKVSGIMSTVKQDISNKIEGAKQKVSSAVQTIKDKMSFAGLASKVSGVFAGVKNSISEKMDAAKQAVSGAIDRIKGILSGSISFPHITLPHFTVTGTPPFGLGGHGTPPHISVSWYAKAMEKARVLSSPTIFGAGSDGSLLGGGEAGNEVISGEKHLLDMMANVVSAQNRALIANFDTTNMESMLAGITQILSRYLPQQKIAVVDLDSYTDKINRKLGMSIG